VQRTLLITFGGAIGTLLRYLTSLAAARWLGPEFSYGTLIVNLSGAFIIGLVQQVGSEEALLADGVGCLASRMDQHRCDDGCLSQSVFSRHRCRPGPSLTTELSHATDRGRAGPDANLHRAN